jgi:hypothetical protein
MQSGTLEDNAMKAILLDTHYRFDKVENMVGLLDVIVIESLASFLLDDVIRTIIVICTTVSDTNIAMSDSLNF